MNRPGPTTYPKITLNKEGSRQYRKMSFPLHCGIYHELETENYIFHFNQNHEILRAKSKGRDWPHPNEWLKRTMANDWVYYSSGGYTGVFEATGEYYLPNFQYPSNRILGGHPFRDREVSNLAERWHSLLLSSLKQYPISASAFAADILQNSPQVLQKREKDFHGIIGGDISVLPPDARHVDYNIIPLTVSSGCLYKCKFCKIKNNAKFQEKSQEEVATQIEKLKKHFSRDIVNYNSLFLGDHDALQCNHNLLFFAIEQAYQEFGIQQSHLTHPKIFLFGSVDSFLAAEDAFFIEIERSPFEFFINLGFESADQQTLNTIGKPITTKQVKQAFSRMQEINDRYRSIEITANFIMDENLPENHYPSILALIRDELVHKKPKGTIYFSPLSFDNPQREKLFEFSRLKIKSRLPTYLYIIQKL